MLGRSRIAPWFLVLSLLAVSALSLEAGKTEVEAEETMLSAADIASRIEGTVHAKMEADTAEEELLREAQHMQSMTYATSKAAVTIMNPQQQGPLSIKLARATIGDVETVLLALKMRQKDLLSDNVDPAELNAPTGASSLLSLREMNVPLKQEVLREKHLATYYGLVKIGDETFRILFDTGSCEFWVPSTACKTARCRRHNRYTWPPKRNVQRFRSTNGGGLLIQYLSGRVSGDMIYEAVQTGDVIVHSQVVGVADHVDIVLLDDVIWDGILGLAYPNRKLRERGISSFFDNVINSEALSRRGLSNSIAYYIDDTRGVVTFGGPDCNLLNTRECSHKFKYVPVTRKAYWTIGIKDVRIQYPGQAERGGFCGVGGCTAIVDTGTYLLYGPGHAVRKMFRNSHGASNSHNCHDHTALPDFIFDFKVENDDHPVTLRLRPIDYVLKFENDGREDCITGISPDRDTIWTLGQVFLRSFYTIFDRDQDRIGFANLPQRKGLHAINSRRSSLIETSEVQSSQHHASENEMVEAEIIDA